MRHRHLPAHASACRRCRVSASSIRRMPPNSWSARRHATTAVRTSAASDLWPSEGSVSDAMVPLVAAAGFQWMATDEQILARLAGRDADPRTRAGYVDQPERLYAPYRVHAGGAEVGLHVPRSFAVRPHRVRVLGMGRRGGGRPTSSSAWSRQAASTRDEPTGKSRSSRSSSTVRTPGSISRAAAVRFSGRCTASCQAHPDLRTVTMADACAKPTARAARASSRAPGSTPTSTSGLAIATTSARWGQLADARQALESAWPG